MRKPTNKALAVLALLREMGELSAKQVADEIQARTPCGQCDGTGKGDDSRWGCRACYGRGRVLFAYSDAYVALMQLRKHGLVTRRHPLDEFGDETCTYVWVAAVRSPVDELEAAFAAPAAEGHD